MPCFPQRQRQSYLRGRRTWPTEFSAIVLAVFGVEPQSELSYSQEQQVRGGVKRNAFAPPEGLKTISIAYSNSIENRTEAARLKRKKLGEEEEQTLPTFCSQHRCLLRKEPFAPANDASFTVSTERRS